MRPFASPASEQYEAVRALTHPTIGSLGDRVALDAVANHCRPRESLGLDVVVDEPDGRQLVGLDAENERLVLDSACHDPDDEPRGCSSGGRTGLLRAALAAFPSAELFFP